MSDAHTRPAQDAEIPLTAPDVPAPSHAERARTLAEQQRTGTLCTIARDPEGYPYGSFTTYALTAAGDPVFFISELAEHTQNLRHDARASLLVAEPSDADPLASGRVTLVGPCAPVRPGAERDTAKAAFLAAHPNAAYYERYGDFAVWRLDVEAVRYIGGYGRMSWVKLPAWRAAAPDPLAPHRAGNLEHMNADHGHNLVDYARAFSPARDATQATMTAIDRYGIELSVETTRGPRPLRLGFPAPITTPQDARRELVTLAQRAREILAA